MERRFHVAAELRTNSKQWLRASSILNSSIDRNRPRHISSGCLPGCYACSVSEPKNQHIIPRCYLKQFVDPNIPAHYEPCVWIFERDSKKGKKKAPKNILAETDFYTLTDKNKEKNYALEKTLAQIEGEYASLFERKIKQKLPLSEEEHIVLCAFVAAMLQRTEKQKENIEGFLDQIIARTEAMERANGLPDFQSKALKKKRENAHQMSVIRTLPEITNILLKMNLAFLCTNQKGSFITSDTPCFLFNSRLQWQSFYGPGLGQKYIEVRMPLSPEISVCFSWANNVRGYLGITTDRIHECNRMVYGHSNKHFIANSPILRRRWFSRYPLSPTFLLKFVKHKIQVWRKRRPRRHR